MTPAELEKKLDRLVAYTKQLVEEHNALEKRVEALEVELLAFEKHAQRDKALAAAEE